MTGFRLTFSEPVGELTTEVTARDFAETALGRAGVMKLDGMRTQFVLERCVIGGRMFQVTVAFEGQKLARVELFLHLPGEKAGWEHWSEEGERRRKGEGDRWLGEVFGRPELKGIWSVPAAGMWDAARGIRFEWGEAWSVYDAKGGCSVVVIRCG